MARLDRKLNQYPDIKGAIVDGTDMSEDVLGNVATTMSNLEDIEGALNDLVGDTTRLRTIHEESEQSVSASQ